MIKKKSNSQNVVIAILSVLLLISIAFGVTYSYYNGKSNLIKGTITTANLSIRLFGESSFGQTSEFSISAPFGEEFLVPGNKLNNVELNLINKCTQSTYMVVVYSLSAFKNDETKEDVTDRLTNMPAISFKDNSIDSNVWKAVSYKCENTNATLTCLVGINAFEPTGNSDGVVVNILKPNSIEIPGEWDNALQNCCVTISVVTYAIQSDYLPPEYRDPILIAEADHNIEAKTQAIAKATLQICQIDKAAANV